MTITRRSALLGAGAAVAVAGVPAVMDAKTREVLEMFPQLNPVRQDLVLWTVRKFLKVQRANERLGLTEADVQADLDRRLRGMRPWPQ